MLMFCGRDVAFCGRDVAFCGRDVACNVSTAVDFDICAVVFHCFVFCIFHLLQYRICGNSLHRLCMHHPHAMLKYFFYFFGLLCLSVSQFFGLSTM